MAFGDGADDMALRSAWTEFCAQLQRAGEQVFKDANATSGAQRVDAFRFLTQNLGQAFDLSLETRDTHYPVLHTFCGPTRKLGGDCADFTYQQAWIDGQSTYRLCCTSRSVTLRRPTCSAVNSASATMANSRSTSVGPSVAPTGCPPPLNHESCSSVRDSTVGTSFRRKCSQA